MWEVGVGPGRRQVAEGMPRSREEHFWLSRELAWLFEGQKGSLGGRIRVEGWGAGCG